MLFDNENINVNRLINQKYTLTQIIPNAEIILTFESNSNNDFTFFSYFNIQMYGYCSSLYCATCPYASPNCSSCLEKHYLLQGDCISCQGLNEYCKSCSSADYCDTCTRDYTTYAGICVKCLVKNCVLCKQTNRCSECE